MLRIQTSLALFAVSLAVVAGCSDDGTSSSPSPSPSPSPTSPTPTPTPGDAASVRVVHASPDAPAVDVYVAGQSAPVVKGAKFGDASPYLSVPAGKYRFEIRPAGAPATDPAVLTTPELDVPAKGKITAIAAGLLAGKTDEDKLRVLAFAEGFKTAADKATVRVVHASADAPTVGIDVGNDDPSKPEIASLARFADTGADGVQLPAGKPLAIGVTAQRARVTAFTTPELPAGSELFVIATGLVGKLPRESSGFQLLAVGPAGAIGFVKQDPVVYALHASPDAPDVDLFVGANEIADNLGFGRISKPIQVPPGEYTIDFFGTTAGSTRPAGAPAASKKTPKLEPGQRYLAAATGFLARSGAANAFTLEAQAEAFDLSDASKGVVRAWHASPDAPAVDIGPIAGTSISPAFAGAAYPKATDPKGLALAPATLPLGVTPAGQNGSILFRFDVPVAAGVRAFAIAAGAVAPQASEKSFRLLVVDTAPAAWTVAEVAPKGD